MQKTKLKELIISWFGSKTSYNLHKSENPDGLNLVPLDFDGSLQENGWTKLPNGLILQWGKCTTNADFIFPITLSKVLGCWRQMLDATSSNNVLFREYAITVTPSKATLPISNPETENYVFVVGF